MTSKVIGMKQGVQLGIINVQKTHELNVLRVLCNSYKAIYGIYTRMYVMCRRITRASLSIRTFLLSHSNCCTLMMSYMTTTAVLKICEQIYFFHLMSIFVLIRPVFILCHCVLIVEVLSLFSKNSQQCLILYYRYEKKDPY